ncbi:MAG: tail fiber domain-containing protein [Chitinispirillaceae bacterium]|jgi:hypothetical protein
MNRIFTFKQSRSRAILAGVCSIVFAASISAQVTSVKLPAADSSASFQVQNSGSATLLRLNGDAGFYYGGVFGTGVIPAQGAGTRLMWYPAKGAFRAGFVSSAEWDSAYVGINSTAFGYGTLAAGTFSTAMGHNTIASVGASTAMGDGARASGSYSTAMGYSTTASGSSSTAMGNTTTASGSYSTAMGYWSVASAPSSTAMGSYTKASGTYSTAMGDYTTASGTYSSAMGCYDTASGFASTAMGSYVSTNGHQGSFIIGDYFPQTPTSSTADNQMTMRFAGGYNLFADGAATIGVSLSAGGNSWSAISDSTKKTNFQKADGDYFLSSLSKLRLGSWNYKAQDAKNYRHYGPMAQEIFHYFGHDGKGIIGCDTLLASADMDGIMMICLQALEKRTSELQKANDKISALQSSVDEMRSEMISMKSELQSLAAARTGKSQEKIALNTISKGQ